jgi:hypothetical protein
MIHTLNTVAIWTGMDGIRQLRPHFSDGPLKEHNYLYMLQSWFVPQVETLDMNDDYRHVTHSLLGNTLVRFSGNVNLAIGHQRCPFHLTVLLEVQAFSHVILHFELLKGNTYTAALTSHLRP